jgi:hypothetical protein
MTLPLMLHRVRNAAAHQIPLTNLPDWDAI